MYELLVFNVEWGGGAFTIDFYRKEIMVIIFFFFLNV